jgi:hypothetical protein
LSGEDDRSAAVSPEEAEYFRSIEERFCALRGAAMLLSPRDWNLIAGWWAERIPFSLIVEALEEVFVARRRRGDERERVNSLSYIKPEILRRWKLHREMTAPRRGEREEREKLRQEMRRHLGRVARSLKEASSAARERDLESLARTLLEASAEVRRSRREASAEGWDSLEAEKSLERLDVELLDAAGSALDRAGRLRLDREAEEILRPHRPGMKTEAFRESLAAVRGRLLRRQFGLPRLSIL